MSDQPASAPAVIPTDDPERYLAHNAESWARAIIADLVEFVAGTVPGGITGVSEVPAAVSVVRLSDDRLGVSFRLGESFYNVLVGG